jgi:hypothetical protein
MLGIMTDRLYLNKITGTQEKVSLKETKITSPFKAL